MTGGRRLVLLAVPALLTVLWAAPCAPAAGDDALANQLRGRGIKDDRVLGAMARVPRAVFAPPEARGRAGEDVALPIGHGQTMSQPYVVALMTELLELRPEDRVLEIGTGSGYQAAVLSELARDVFSVEIVPELAGGARLRLAREGYRNVHVKQGDGALGWRDYAPYDAVIVTAAAPSVPRALIDQLREGGVLVMPLGDPDGRQVLVRGVKRGTKLRTREVTDVRFVPLTGAGAHVRNPDERGAPREDGRGRSADERAAPRDDGRAPSATGASPPSVPNDDDDDDERAVERPRRERERQPADAGTAPRVTRPSDGTAPRSGGVIEEEIPAPDPDDSESGPRSRRDGRARVAHARDVRGSDRRSAAGGAARAVADSRPAARRCAG